MKTKDFLKQHSACKDGARWALSISKDMGDVWEAMIAEEKHAWLIWTATRRGVFPSSTLRKLACRFVRETPLTDGRKVWDLLTDERSRKAVEVAELYADGKATNEELKAAFDATFAAARAANAAAYAAARAANAANAAYTAYALALNAADAAYHAAADANAADAAANAADAAANAADAAYAARAAADANAADAARAAANAADAHAKSAQVRMIAELGNPFKEEEGQEDE